MRDAGGTAAIHLIDLVIETLASIRFSYRR